MAAETNLEQTGPQRGSLASYALVFGKVMRGDVREAGYDDKVNEVHEFNRACAFVAAAIAAEPLPFVDLALIIPIQLRLIQALAKLNGQQLSKGAASEILDLYGLGIAAQYGLIGLAKLAPVAGSLVAPPIVFALTLAIGELADHYIRHGRGVLPRPLTAAWLQDRNIKKTFRKVFNQRKAEFRELRDSDADFSAKLEQLRTAYTKALMSEEEYQQVKGEMLRAFSRAP